MTSTESRIPGGSIITTIPTEFGRFVREIIAVIFMKEKHAIVYLGEDDIP